MDKPNSQYSWIFCMVNDNIGIGYPKIDFGQIELHHYTDEFQSGIDWLIANFNEDLTKKIIIEKRI